MFYQLVRRSNLVRNPFVADKWMPSHITERDFCSGRVIRSWPKEVSFIASTPKMDGDLDDFVVNNVPAPLITPRLLGLIGSLNVPAFQALPAEAIWSSGRRERIYALNITELIPGIDLEKSEAFWFDDDFPNPALRGKLNSVCTAALIVEKISRWDLFRCKEYPDHLFASDRFKKRFELGGMTGVSFGSVRLL